MARYEQRAPLPAGYVEPRSYPVEPQRQQPQLVDAPVSGTVRRSGGYRSGRHPVTRMFGTLLIMMFLAAVPVVSGYIAFKMIVGEPPLPVDLDPFLRALRRLAT
jgi:hypothetical protein